MHWSKLCCRAYALSFLVGLGIAVSTASCGSGGGASAARVATGDSLPDHVLAGLDEVPHFPQTLAQIVLPNGYSAEDFLALWGGVDGASGEIGPQDARNLMIAWMCSRANELVDRSQWIKPDEGAGRPAQTGLAYVFGGKGVEARSRYQANCCPWLYGLDCSGFLAQVFAAAGVVLPVGPASTQRSAAVLTRAIKAKSTFSRLYAEDVGVLAVNELETGDVIYWNDAAGRTKHIGVVLGGAIYQSNGSSSCDAEQCERNQGPNRGPRTLRLEQATTFFSSSGLTVGGVVRIFAEISGDWRFRFRCQTASFDVIDAPIRFPTTASNEFQVTEQFLDYNQQPLSGQFLFSYDKVDNLLSCTIHISSPNCAVNPFRSETFAVRLDRDDTGYLATTEIYRNSCAGCLAAIRLQNLETTRLPSQVDRLLELLQSPEPMVALGPTAR